MTERKTVKPFPAEVGRRHVADAGHALVGAQGVGHAAGQAHRAEDGYRGPRPQAVLLHRIWQDGSEFRWSKEVVA